MKKLLLSFALLGILSCSKSDDVPLIEKDHRLTAVVENSAFEAEGIANVVAQYEQLENGFYRFAIVASSKVEGSDDTKRILVSVLLTRPSFFSEGLVASDSQELITSNPYSFYEEVAGTTDLQIFRADTQETRLSSFSISKLDTIENIISGTFRFTGRDQRLNRLHEVEQGIFNNVKYNELTTE